MNILITAPSLNPSKNVSGVATVVNTIIANNNNHHYFHYLLGRPDQPMNKVKWLLQLLKQFILLPFFLKRNKIELVHQNLPFDPKGVLREYIINLWCMLMGVPVILHVHGGVFLMNGTSNLFFKNLSKSLFKHSRQVVVLSELEKEALNRLYQFSSAKVLYNSIDTATFKMDRQQDIKDMSTLLFLGRIHESKGVEDMVEAFRLLKEKKDFRFILCGTGPLKDYFIESCEKILGANFEYLGIVSGNVKVDIIQKSDFFLLPSRYGEGLPMALLETMAAGVIPVVTDDASMKYVVQHQINGIRVQKRNPKDLYDKLNNVLSDSVMQAELSDSAMRTVTEDYDVLNYVVKLNEIYNSVITD